MAYNLPIAPKNFYTPSLSTLKSKLEVVSNGVTGQISLLTAAPVDIETAWNEVGSGSYIDVVNGRGSLVVGVAPVSSISDPVVGPEDGITGEIGYKLQFGIIPAMTVYIDGSGSTTTTVIGIAMIVGRDFLGNGSDADVLYIGKLKEATLVKDGSVISLPEWEIAINYAEVV